MCPLTANPLRLSPPDMLVTPPTPSPRSRAGPNAMYNLPHASTSSARIISPIILIPGHDPLCTTLTPQQLSELLPTLHIYIVPSQPSLAILPAAGISCIGLRKALLWREADIQGPGEVLESNLSELVQIFQALTFLGNKSTSRNLWPLGKMIMSEINNGLSLTEYQDLWALRYLPFTEAFIKAIVKRLALMESGLAKWSEHPSFQWMRDNDAVFARKVDVAIWILRWVYESGNLTQKVQRACAELEGAQKRAARMEKHGGGSAVQKFKARLETVQE
ncbi:hypothetical protein K458DRAFT_400176 [Lentithecium fluviatile CBS 122367]|uniref:Uncharacterized protein n=1 Tax=Lentithecium fluviatile CBS 122367 TaxID=1168545 RepID=A0A6G1JGZ2_9PLEO|nr:hypothetical protein K458DRAFT_400176 [Lentithecium fluviatile CBS 122367]